MGEEAVCVEVLADGRSENDEIPRTELKRDCECLADTEPLSSPNKKHAKEVSNDDVRSEVSNPNLSLKENLLSFQDISSQPTELANANQAECGEVTSTCLENSSSDETLSDGGGVHNNTSQVDKGTSSTAMTSCVVLEIPKHASSSGIRKITFKFSKKKEDYDHQSLSTTNRHPYDEDPLLSADYNSGMLDSPYGMEYVQTGDSNLYARNMELKMSKKVVPSCYPTNVKKLLSTGILDGARVKYIYTNNAGQVKHTILQLLSFIYSWWIIFLRFEVVVRLSYLGLFRVVDICVAVQCAISPE